MSGDRCAHRLGSGTAADVCVAGVDGPDLDLMLSLDPEGAPWGPRDERWLIDRVVGTARRAVDRGAEVVVLPVQHRERHGARARTRGPGGLDPVIGTVPAISPPRRCATRWRSGQRRPRPRGLPGQSREGIRERQFGGGGGVPRARRRDRLGDVEAARAAIAAAAARTPDDVTGVSCWAARTTRSSRRDRGAPAGRGGAVDSAEAVAAQTLRRIVDAIGRDTTGQGTVEVLLSGTRGELRSVPRTSTPDGSCSRRRRADGPARVVGVSPRRAMPAATTCATGGRVPHGAAGGCRRDRADGLPAAENIAATHAFAHARRVPGRDRDAGAGLEDPHRGVVQVRPEAAQVVADVGVRFGSRQMITRITDEG